MKIDITIKDYTKELNLPVIEWYSGEANFNKIKELFPGIGTNLISNKSIWIKTQEQVDYLQSLVYFPYDYWSLNYELLL